MVLVLSYVGQEQSDLFGGQLSVHDVLYGVLVWMALRCLLRWSEQMAGLASWLGGTRRNLLLLHLIRRLWPSTLLDASGQLLGELTDVVQLVLLRRALLI